MRPQTAKLHTVNSLEWTPLGQALYTYLREMSVL